MVTVVLNILMGTLVGVLLWWLRNDLGNDLCTDDGLTAFCCFPRQRTRKFVKRTPVKRTEQSSSESELEFP